MRLLRVLYRPDDTPGTTSGQDTAVAIGTQGEAAGDPGSESKSDPEEQIQENSPQVKKSAKLCKFHLENKCRYGVSGKDCGYTHPARDHVKNENIESKVNGKDPGKLKQQKTVPTGRSLKNCTFYLRNKCRYGVSGNGCGFTHPKRCNKFMDLGWYGCKSDALCKKFHPRVCNDSYRHMQCNKINCDLLHIRKTRKPLEHQQGVAGAANTQENANPNNLQQLPNYNRVFQSRGGKQVRVPRDNTRFENHVKCFPPAKNPPRQSDQDNKPPHGVCDARMPYAVHGLHHYSAEQHDASHMRHAKLNKQDSMDLVLRFPDYNQQI